MSAQEENVQTAINKLQKTKEQIILSEKEALRAEVAEIYERLAEDEISEEVAQQEKEAAAKRRALNIENQNSIIENQIALIERNGTDSVSENNVSMVQIGIGAKDPKDGDIIFGIKYSDNKEEKVKYDRRTSNGLVVAFGFNNAIQEGISLEDTDYKIGGSRFFELGWVWNTRVFKNSNVVRAR